MFTIIFSFFSSIRQGFRTRAALHAEILALQHQLLVLQRSSRGHRLRLARPDRLLMGVACAFLERLAIRADYRQA